MYHLAQLNIAQLVAPLDSLQLKGFVDQLEGINALADNAPGFVWRLQTEEGDATGIDAFGDDIIVNLSVWENAEALRAFVYGVAHRDVMRGRRQWFKKMEAAHLVMWWIKKGDLPTVEDARDRLDHLRAQGHSARAFDFRHLYPIAQPCGRPTPKRTD
ncbi:MAG: DUF3291 domain-containing protein [Pseudomonadota bacterium]